MLVRSDAGNTIKLRGRPKGLRYQASLEYSDVAASSSRGYGYNPEVLIPPLFGGGDNG